VRPARAVVLAVGVSGAACGPVTTGADDDATPEAWGQEELPAAACVGDGDGAVGPVELAVDPSAGVTATFLVNAEGSVVTVDSPGGAEDGAGGRLYPFDGPTTQGDRVVEIGPEPITGAWFADRFPGGQYHALLDATTGVRGVFAVDGDDSSATVRLLGIASDAEGETVLVYDPPVDLFRLPMRVGDGWDTAADAAGLAGGAEYPQDLGEDGVVSLVHRYTFAVDAAGTAVLPAADLPVLRLRGEVRVEAYNSLAGLFAADAERVDFFVAECLGTVARVRSLEGEVDPDFSQARELLRFGFDPGVWP